MAVIATFNRVRTKVRHPSAQLEFDFGDSSIPSVHRPPGTTTTSTFTTAPRLSLPQAVAPHRRIFIDTLLTAIKGDGDSGGSVLMSNRKELFERTCEAVRLSSTDTVSERLTTIQILSRIENENYMIWIRENQGFTHTTKPEQTHEERENFYKFAGSLKTALEGHEIFDRILRKHGLEDARGFLTLVYRSFVDKKDVRAGVNDFHSFVHRIEKLDCKSLLNQQNLGAILALVSRGFSGSETMSCVEKAIEKFPPIVSPLLNDQISDRKARLTCCLGLITKIAHKSSSPDGPFAVAAIITSTIKEIDEITTMPIPQLSVFLSTLAEKRQTVPEHSLQGQV